ncbi:peptidase M23 [Cypionkella aquatica]|uniref:Peptidase M23 n=1 Tax=Cypionkella aquatica TaxID=1756042 RepID=A0AA37U9L8_9RHOB|nr:M23 family metallopeptidase [Cypionkella aquatica]GLS87656.1 peptidase M23 [Cypionkella aquatica]
MLTRLSYRIHTTLERHLPEQRLFLKSDTETRFIRLRSSTQAIALVFGALALAWTILATAILLLDSISAGTSRQQVARQQALYEQRLNDLSADRDLRADEAASSQGRFNLALAQVSQMQARLLASEDRRRELETGIDVIQNTLRGVIKERDSVRAQLASLSDAPAAGRTEEEKLADADATLEMMTASLGATAQQRDVMQTQAVKADERTAKVTQEKQQLEARNDAIFEQLEQALTVSVEPLDKMFREAGQSPEKLLSEVRKGYSGQGGPLTPISLSTSGMAPSADEQRANAILKSLDNMNMYRIAAFKAPFGMPVKTAVRYTSGFGGRNDPLGRGFRRHEGQDMAGDYGTPIYSTADGVVTYAGWENGYGRLVKIQHAFGIETRYGHMSQIRAEVGQKVSRGDQIGDMGNSGRSTGTHLHYEIRIGGSAINPMTFIKAAKNVF